MAENPAAPETGNPSANAAWLTTECTIDSQPMCDPNTPGDCDQLYKPAKFTALDQTADDPIQWCWCTAKVPPGWSPPPPGMNMQYKCCCDENQCR
jgi:hypothetical protein